MNSLLIVANWKSNKTTKEALQWLENFKISDLNLENKEIIICPSFTLLGVLKDKIGEMGLPIKLGAQDISPFEEGAHTGDVNGRQIKEFADYVIIGHSERRKHFHEDDNLLEKKVSMALSSNLLSIFCVSDSGMDIPQEVKIVAYEPIFAIGTGNPDTPENASLVAKTIKETNKNVTHVLYGGSVTSENIKSFTTAPNMDGVLVGKASLDASEFLKIVQNA